MFNFINKVKNIKSEPIIYSKKSFKYSTKQSIFSSTSYKVNSHWEEYKYLTPLQKSTQMFIISKDWVNSMSVKTKYQKINIGKWFSHLDKEVDSFLKYTKPNYIDSNIVMSNINLKTISYEELAPEKSPMEVLYLLAEALEYQNISYAIGGSLALSHYTVPRVTSNIDLNVWIYTKNELFSMINVLHSISPVKIIFGKEFYNEKNIMHFFWNDIKIKIFLPLYSSLVDQMKNTIQLGLPHPVTLKEIKIISKESLAIFKLWWSRDKDIDDLKMLLFMNDDIKSSIVIQGIKTLFEMSQIDSRSIFTEKIYIWEKLYKDFNNKAKLE